MKKVQPAAFQRFFICRRAHEAVDDCDVWIHLVIAQPSRLIEQHVIVLVHPRPRRVRRYETETKRAHAPLAGFTNRTDVGARDP